MNRRRFVKYVGAGAALVGSALAGYEFDRWQDQLVPPSVSTVTQTRTQELVWWAMRLIDGRALWFLCLSP